MIYPPNLRDYQSDKDNFRLEIPEFYNFGFDVIDGRAATADKDAFIYVPTAGEPIERHTYSDLSAASNRFANVLRALGADKGDFALLQIPRVPAFYQVLIGAIKTGVVAIPGTYFPSSAFPRTESTWPMRFMENPPSLRMPLQSSVL